MSITGKSSSRLTNVSVGYSIFGRESIGTPLFVTNTTHSLLKATIGDSFDVFHAGYNPASILNPTDIPNTLARSFIRKTGAKLDDKPCVLEAEENSVTRA